MSGANEGDINIFFGFINLVDNVYWPPQRDSKADVSSVSPSSELRANARNVSFRIFLRWSIHIINPDDKTKLSCYTSHRRSSTTVPLGPDYMANFSPVSGTNSHEIKLAITWRRTQPGLRNGISARAEKQKRGWLSLRSRSDFSGIKAIKWRISLISKLRWNMRASRQG